MTLVDFLRLVRHYLALVVAITLICTCAGFGVSTIKTGLSGKEYTANAVLTVTEATQTVAPSELLYMVNSIARNITASMSNGEIRVTNEVATATRSISFEAVAPSEAESISAANQAAERTIEVSVSTLSNLAQNYRDAAVQSKGGSEGDKSLGSVEENRAAAYETVSFTLNDASQAASDSGKSTLLKYSLAGFLLGLIAASCIVVLVNLLKRPVKSPEDLEDRFEIPLILESRDRNPGNRLWANIRFAADKTPRSVCLVPVSTYDVYKLSHDVIDAIAESPVLEGASTSVGPEEVRIFACDSLSFDIKGAYEARNAEATVLCVKKWKDSINQVSDALNELKLAHANVVGIALD